MRYKIITDMDEAEILLDAGLLYFGWSHQEPDIYWELDNRGYYSAYPVFGPKQLRESGTRGGLIYSVLVEECDNE